MKKLFIALLAALLLAFAACAAPQQETAAPEPAQSEPASAVSWDDLTFDRTLPLQYATQFSVSYAGEDYTRLTIGDDQTFLVVAGDAPVLDQEPTGQTVAFFYITTSGAVNVRKSGDYIAKAIRMAGGEYVSFDESGEENALSTMTIQMESFYDTALDADVLIYNSTIDGGITSIDELLAKSPLFADFKAVQTGNVWCITKNFYQESLALGDMILDVHAVLNNPDAADLRFLKKLS